MDFSPHGTDDCQTTGHRNDSLGQVWGVREREKRGSGREKGGKRQGEKGEREGGRKREMFD